MKSRGFGSLILLRHGKSLFNVENRFTGWKDPELAPEGIREAQEAARALRGEKIDVAFVSRQKRAKQTLDVLISEAGFAHLKIRKSAALNERCYGQLEGLNKADVIRKYGAQQVYLWRRSYREKPPGGESLKDTADRVIPYYKKNICPSLKDGKNCLVVAHGNSLRALMMYLENIPPEAISGIEIATGVPRKYSFGNGMNLPKVQDIRVL